jgi:predicted Ser/Thr protein kinase
VDNPANLTGQTIGKYRVVEHLGRGGMAEVYKAYQPSLDRYVALKLMHAFLAGDQDFISRFEREAKNVAALRHPNIVQVYDFDVHNGTPYMVMEFIEGGTLKSHLEDLARQGKALSTAEAVHIIREVGKALSFAHAHQMIHRDVKPANVLLETDGRVILTDFGIAKILTGPSYTVTGATIGTPAYMSPEQGLGRPGDHRSDIYALGVMLYQLTTGQLPYEADTPLAVMLKHVNEPLPLPRTIKPDLPEGIERIILKSMAKNPDDRFESADEMLAQLDNLETAQLIAIPPASMAAGASAHAATVAMGTGMAKLATGTVSSGAPPIPPADATRLASAAGAPPGRTGTVINRTGIAPAADALATRDRGRRFAIGLFAVVGLLLLLLLLAGGAFAFTGGFGLLNHPAATNTEFVATSTGLPSATSTTIPSPSATLPTGSATPDRVGTQLSSLQETQAAIQAAVASPTASNTPDLTATAAACSYDYQLAGQQPEDGHAVLVNAKTTKTLTLKNTGTCPFQPGTVLSETTRLSTPPAAISVTVPAIAPGATGDVAFDWPGRKSVGQAVRVFKLLGPDLLVIGQPVTLTLKYILASTPIPLATATNPPPAATDTPPAPAGLTDIYIQSVTGCHYVGDTSMDYQCTGILGQVGGVGPFTVSVDGTNSQHVDVGQTITFVIRARRCTQWIHTINLFDDGTKTEKDKPQSFDPGGNGSLFPGGACTVS